MGKRQSGQKKRTARRTDGQKGSVRRLVPYMLLTLCLCALGFAGCAVYTLHSGAAANADHWRLTAVLGLCVFCGGFFAAKKEKQKGLLTGLLAALPALVVLLCLSLVFGSGGVDFSLPLSFVPLLLLSMLGGVLGVNKRQSVRRAAKRR